MAKLLKRRQKKALLQWIAEGLQSDEINARGAEFDPPFNVSRQQVDYYRRTRRIDLEAIQHIDEQTALTQGYADKQHRVYKLSLLAALLENDLLNGLLWTDDVKGVGAGAVAEVVDFEQFNRAEVDAYRGVLDDIAKETGGRIVRTDLTTDGKPIPAPVIYLPQVEPISPATPDDPADA